MSEDSKLQIVKLDLQGQFVPATIRQAWAVYDIVEGTYKVPSVPYHELRPGESLRKVLLVE